MDVSNIEFTANINDPFDIPLSKKKLAIQLFHVGKMQWLTLTRDLSVQNGLLKHIISAKKEQSTSEEMTVLVKSLEAGVLPTLRLVDEETLTSSWVNVFGFACILFEREKGVLVVDFGEMWSIAPHSIKRHIEGDQPKFEYELATLPRPHKNHTLYAGLQATILDPKLFESFSSETHLSPLKTVKELQNLTEEEALRYNTQLETVKYALSRKIEEVNIVESVLEKIQNDPTFIVDQEVADYLDSVKIDSIKDVRYKDLLGNVKLAEPVAAKDVYVNIVDELSIATEKLDGSNYELSNLNLNLKTMVQSTTEGFKLQLMDAETARVVNTDAISEVNIGIVTKPVKTNGTVLRGTPKIIGLSETAARKHLKNFGFHLKAIYQVAPNKVIGHAFKQSPASGAEMGEGNTVTAIFAKESEKFN